jgi:transglutaminase-like putative cysteine protease
MLRSFQISTGPRAQLYAYTDHHGNAVYHFNVLREHSELRLETVSVVEMQPVPLPNAPTDSLEWSRYNRYNLTDEHHDLLQPSVFAKQGGALTAFTEEHGLSVPEQDPFTALKHLNKRIYEIFDYETGITGVHSPIEHALEARRGVCQDFAHIMIAVARSWGIPTRYVSGYLHHRTGYQDRSAADATHAWVEAYLPSYGWVGFDPTNNILAGSRHIRAAIGRDYADVPPTRGTYKGDAESELAIAVSVAPTQAPAQTADVLHVTRSEKTSVVKSPTADWSFHQQQQQQQQQQ